MSAISLSAGRPTIKPRVTRPVSPSRHFDKAPPLQLRADRVHVTSTDNSEEPFYDGASPGVLDGSYIGSRADTTNTC